MTGDRQRTAVNPAASAALVAAIVTVFAPTVEGHENLPGFLELGETSPGTYSVLWRHPTGGDAQIRVTPVLPESCAFGSGQELAPGAPIVRGTLRCAEGLRGETIRISGLAATMTDVLVRLRPLNGQIENHLVTPAEPSVVLGETTAARGGAASYLALGIQHILLGADHLLFVLGLLLIVAGRWQLVRTITAFTVAHSITLGVATLGYAQAPGALLSAAIASSILCLGPEAVRASRGGTSITIRHPWIVAFGFGLLHGFGFASGLASLGLPQDEIPIALLLFNFGVEVGQLAFVLLALGLAWSFRILEIRWPRLVQLIPAYAVGTLGAYWTIQRTLVLAGGRG